MRGAPLSARLLAISAGIEPIEASSPAPQESNTSSDHLTRMQADTLTAFL